MRSYYDFIYLSPHLDDAALSCGGQIFAQTKSGQTVLIVTIMAGDPPTPMLTEFMHSLHARWELLTDATVARRAEDIAACRILGADYVHWEFADCVYRPHPVTGEPMYADETSIFGDVHPAESALPELLAQHIISLPEYKRLLVPLTVGHHVDHQITRLAAERAVDPIHICYYEEYPYASKAKAMDTLVAGSSQEWQAEVIPLSSADIQARVEAIAAFSSQISTFFANDDDLARQVSNYVQLVGGERIWRRQTFLTIS